MRVSDEDWVDEVAREWEEQERGQGSACLPDHTDTEMQPNTIVPPMSATTFVEAVKEILIATTSGLAPGTAAEVVPDHRSSGKDHKEQFMDVRQKAPESLPKIVISSGGTFARLDSIRKWENKVAIICGKVSHKYGRHYWKEQVRHAIANHKKFCECDDGEKAVFGRAPVYEPSVEEAQIEIFMIDMLLEAAPHHVSEFIMSRYKEPRVSDVLFGILKTAMAGYSCDRGALLKGAHDLVIRSVEDGGPALDKWLSHLNIIHYWDILLPDLGALFTTLQEATENQITKLREDVRADLRDVRRRDRLVSLSGNPIVAGPDGSNVLHPQFEQYVRMLEGAFRARAAEFESR